MMTEGLLHDDITARMIPRRSCCDIVLDKIKDLFSCCFHQNRFVHFEDEVLPVSPSTYSATTISLESKLTPQADAQDAQTPVVRSAQTTDSLISRCLRHPLFTGPFAVASATVLAVSAGLYTPIVNDFSSTCIDELNALSDSLITCEEPYVNSITLYQVLIGTTSCILGFMTQAWLEPRLEPDSPEVEENTSTCLQNVKQAFAHIQANYSYEIHLATGYLYGGLWINTSTVDTWTSFYQCQAASIGLASSFLGMYLRTSYVALKKLLSNVSTSSTFSLEPFEWKRQWKKGIATTIAAVFLGLSTAQPSLFGEEASTVIQDLAVMTLAYPLGELLNRFLSHRQENAPDASCTKKTYRHLATGLSQAPVPLIALSYYIYLQQSSIGGMFLLGAAMGLNDVTQQPTYEPILQEPLVLEEEGCCTLLRQTGRFIKNYWKTGALIAFTIASAESNFLSCYDVSTYDCPISFEFAGNYNNYDGRGLSTCITMGLVSYYARRLFKMLRHQQNEYLQKIGSAYIQMTDKYQFDLLSLIPYTIEQSGSYIPSFGDKATFNPAATLLLLGFTIGNYKEKVNSRSMSSKDTPATADSSVIAAMI